MDDNKVYEPVEIQPIPFPQQDQIVVTESSGGGKTSEVFNQPSVTSQNFPVKRVAHDLFSEVLNTRSKKVRGEFELLDAGGFRIGNYQPGVSGEMLLTPAGQTAKNMAGQTTFAIDAETGNVIFLGEIRGGTIDIGNNFTVDVDGNVIANSIALASADAISTSATGGQEFTGTEEDVTDTEQTIVLERSTLILILVTGNRYIAQVGSGDFGGSGIVRLKVDGFERDRSTSQAGKTGTDSNGGQLSPLVLHFLGTLAKGTHTIKLTGECSQLTGSSKMVLFGYRLSRVTLGTSL